MRFFTLHVGLRVSSVKILSQAPQSARDDRVPPSSRRVDFIAYLFCDSPNVDVALTWNADKQKAPRDARPKALVLLGNFGCGSQI